MNTELKNDAVPHAQEPLSSLTRVLLFPATYLIGVLIFIGIAVDWPQAIQRNSTSADWLDFFAEYLLVLVGTIIYLPFGLGMFPAVHDRWGTLLSVLSYISVFVIPFIGITTRKHETFRILYFIFIALVIMNVAGCLSDVPDVL